MKYPKLRELKEAVKALIFGPYTSKFPKVPHKPALKFRGKPKPDEAECIGCGACAEVCPAGAIELADDKITKTRKITWHDDVCIFCGQCERYCTTKKGVVLSQEFDLADLTRDAMKSEVRKELLICPGCGEVIAPVDQVSWMAKKLGPKALGNTLSLNIIQYALNAPVPVSLQEHGRENSRTNLFKVLCPKCRHKAVILDEYGK